MVERKNVPAFSPQDMKRRRARAIAMALALVVFIVIVFITTIYKMKAGVS